MYEYQNVQGPRKRMETWIWRPLFRDSVEQAFSYTQAVYESQAVSYDIT